MWSVLEIRISFVIIVPNFQLNLIDDFLQFDFSDGLLATVIVVPIIFAVGLAVFVYLRYCSKRSADSALDEKILPGMRGSSVN